MTEREYSTKTDQSPHEKTKRLSAAEQELRNTREQLEAHIEASLDPIVITDAHAFIAKANKAFLDMLGYSREEVIGRLVYEFSVREAGEYRSTAGETIRVDKAFLDRVTEGAARLVKDGKVTSWSSVYQRRDGTLVPVVQNIVMHYAASGERLSSFAIIRDITEQRRNELALKQSSREFESTKQQLENIIETSLDPIIICDSSGVIVDPNRAFLNMIGYERTDVCSRYPFDFGVLEPGEYECTTGEAVRIDDAYLQRQQDAIASFRRDGTISNWVMYYKSSAGKLIPVNQNAVFLYTDTGNRNGSFAIMRDITEQRTTELELILSRKTAEEANKAKSTFLANMSHEIRTPMNGIIGFTDMLMESELSQEQADYVKTIKRSGEALMSLINDILDFSKIEAGRIEIERIDFDIEMLAYDVCELMRPRVERRNVEIMCRISDTLPAKVKGDPHRFRQVLMNLMGNAAKFTNEGEIELALEVEQEEQDRVKIHGRIRDTGIGIPENKLETIFDLFQQADGTTTRKYGGTGLGLSISRKIANLMGGNVWAESELGNGSVFHFTAWLYNPDERSFKRVAPVSLAGKRVIITDDNRTNLEILANILTAAGMQVQGFATSTEALRSLQRAAEEQAPFDICVFDIMMPDMSGYALAKKIRSQFGDTIPMLAFSSISEGGAKYCEDAGFNGFLPKPIKRDKLYKMIERLLGERGRRRKAEAQPAEIITQHSMREEAKQSTMILLAEDNPVNQKLAGALLTKAGYGVSVVGNGQEAFDAYTADNQAYDIIFMDVQMPVMNGHDATKAIRAWEQSEGIKRQGSDGGIPIVAMTANAMKGDREKCLASGMDDYIAKPIKREIVFDMLTRWVMKG